MHAAIIATRSAPVPIVPVYGNRLVAAQQTFICVSSIRTAALITSNGATQQAILFSTSNQQGLLDQITAIYYTLIGQQVIDVPGLLSSTIAQSVAVATVINATIQSLSVFPQKVATLEDIQRRVAGALYTLQHLRVN